jgi:type I restriction-modification system DNA methylase subunit
LRPSVIEQSDLASGRDVLGDAYEYLIGRFAAGAGKKAGEFYTPPEVSPALAKLLARSPANVSMSRRWAAAPWQSNASSI